MLLLDRDRTEAALLQHGPALPPEFLLVFQSCMQPVLPYGNPVPSCTFTTSICNFMVEKICRFGMYMKREDLDRCVHVSRSPAFKAELSGSMEESTAAAAIRIKEMEAEVFGACPVSGSGAAG